MIKLGMFDLDGTLLDSEGKLPGSFYSDIEVLRKRGVHVAIASARPVQFLFEMFDRDVDILISGEDGNVFFKGKELLHARFLSFDIINKIKDRIAQRSDVAIIFSSLDELYVSNEDYSRLKKWGLERFLPETPLSLSGREQICKIHLYCSGGVAMAKEMIAGSFHDLDDECNMSESGYGWIGFMGKDSNKASAFRFFQNYLGLSDDEIAVFGDSENDLSMFELTKYSFAMKNADKSVREKAALVTKYDNDHNGAMKALLEITRAKTES